MNPVFSGSKVDVEFNRRWNRVSEKIGELESIDDAGRTAIDLYEEHRIEPAIFRRDEATFKHDPTEQGISVDMIVPFDGNGTCFTMVPAGRRTYSIATDAEMVNESRRWLQQDTGLPGKYIRFNQTFREPTQETVRAWGKEQADLVETVLAELHEEIHVGNEQFQVKIIAAVKDRKKTLEAGEGLGDLGTGI